MNNYVNEFLVWFIFRNKMEVKVMPQKTSFDSNSDTNCFEIIFLIENMK